jgi:endonuclease YncB( thermonuclease family)
MKAMNSLLSYQWRSILVVLAASLLLAAAPRTVILQGSIVGVHDGDSCTLLVGTTQYKIRLEGIDTPELGQPFGTRAKQGLSKYVFSRQVTVHVSGKDNYGRSLGTIFVDGKNINQQLVIDGLAWHYKQYSNDRKLAQAENIARRAKRGLWVDAGAIPPWQWRRMRTRSSAASKPASLVSGYWLNTASNVRHNNNCRYYKNTKQGRICTGNDGRACKTCGG